MYTENRYTFLSSIVETVDQYSIPFELILNADQTPSSYVSVGKMTMAKCGEKIVPIKGLTDNETLHRNLLLHLCLSQFQLGTSPRETPGDSLKKIARGVGI